MSALVVKFAVYGALAGGDENKTQAVNVQTALQTAIDSSQGIVNINNNTMGGDPSKGNSKHFGAIVALDNVDRYFACYEGQTIDFYHTAEPSDS
jgi:hypothetical protein